MKNIEISEEVLSFAIKNGMIDLSYIQDDFEMYTRKKMLEKHKWAISQGKDGYWRTYLPDEEKGRKMVKKKTEKEVEYEIIAFYKEKEENTFRNIFSAWKERQKKYGVCGNTLQKYNSDYIRFFEGSKFENYILKNVSEEEITEFMVSSVRRLNLKEKAGNSLWGYVCGVFKYARQHKIISENPCDYVQKRTFSKYYNRTKKSVKERTLDNNEIKSLLDKIKESHIKKPNYIQSYAVELAIYTGMRVGELAALRWIDIKSEDGIIYIHQSEKFDRERKEFYISTTKNGEEREFPISEEIRDVLYELKKTEMKSGFLGEYVFQNETGRIHARSISHCMRYKCKQAGIDEKGIHSLRRTLNSKMRCNGVSSVVAASLLGHTEAVNENNYTYDISEMKYKREIISKISKIS